MRAHDWPPAHEVADQVRRGDRKATELLDEAIEVITELDPLLNAWVELDIEQARRVADAVDDVVAAGGDPGPLAGVPFGVKDLEDLAGLATREGSALLKNIPPASSDSVHVARLRAAGGVPIGKTTVPEFGFTGQTATRTYGVTRNPWRRDQTSGGSSGGSATAVASGMVPIATASDGGGSTRIPASFTGLVGLKPSHGRIPYPNPGDTSVLGVLAVSVRDVARHLDIAAGPDHSDHQSLPAPDVRYEAAIESLDLAGMRAAFSPDLGWITVDDEIAAAAEEATRVIAQHAGLELIDCPVRIPNGALAWMVIAADAHLRRLSALGAWPDRAGELEEASRLYVEVRTRFGPTELYLADQRRRQIIAATAAVFRDVDVLFTPTTAMTAPPATGPPPTEIGGRDASLSGVSPQLPFVNFAWNPSIAVPVGIHGNGLPMSLQIVGSRHQDEVPLRLARILELEHPWLRRPPTIDEADPVPPAPSVSPPIELLERVVRWALDLGHDATRFDEAMLAELASYTESLEARPV